MPRLEKHCDIILKRDPAVKYASWKQNLDQYHPEALCHLCRSCLYNYGTCDVQSLPMQKMTNTDLSRILNVEIQQALSTPTKKINRRELKHNLLMNLRTVLKLNPYAKTEKHCDIILKRDPAVKYSSWKQNLINTTQKRYAISVAAASTITGLVMFKACPCRR
ncbi:uncharacterized protein [Clinocottus analis]|uniref:uncharacterized protein n=1 Tax=Clinocottus analis TaxID=304258 RepID=UPI0035C229A5